MKYLFLVLLFVGAQMGAADLGNSKAYNQGFARPKKLIVERVIAGEKKKLAEQDEVNAKEKRTLEKEMLAHPENYVALLLGPNDDKGVEFVVNAFSSHAQLLSQQSCCAALCGTQSICQAKLLANGTHKWQGSTASPGASQAGILDFNGYSDGSAKFVVAKPENCKLLVQEYTAEQLAYIKFLHQQAIQKGLNLTRDALGKGFLQLTNDQEGVHKTLLHPMQEQLERIFIIDGSKKARMSMSVFTDAHANGPSMSASAAQQPEAASGTSLSGVAVSVFGGGSTAQWGRGSIARPSMSVNSRSEFDK